MDKKQKLEATVLLESYDLGAITDICGANSTTGVWPLTATGCSQETGKEGEAEESPSTSRQGLSMRSCL